MSLILGGILTITAFCELGLLIGLWMLPGEEEAKTITLTEPNAEPEDQLELPDELVEQLEEPDQALYEKSLEPLEPIQGIIDDVPNEKEKSFKDEFTFQDGDYLKEMY